MTLSSDLNPTNDDTLLPGGKLPATLLAQLLTVLPTRHPRLLVEPGIGEDAAVIDFPIDQLLVAKSDPITFATDEIGYYAVNVCANDLAVSGAIPRFYLPTLLFPAGATSAADVSRIFAQLAAACAQLNITVVGGHSEITHAVNQPIIAGTMLGEVPRGRHLRSSGCRPGDQILLAGSVPVEGVSIIAREKRTLLLERGWPAPRLDEAAGYLHRPGISVLRPALAAAEAGLVTAMHDPTEGGIATGLLELALAAGCGLEVALDAIPIMPLAADLCAEFGLDPLGTIASGALLATAEPRHVEALLALWANLGWDGAVIGRILPDPNTVYGLWRGERVALPTFAADEITKLWA